MLLVFDLSEFTESLYLVIGTGLPRVPALGPVPVPAKTRTRARGYGFLAGRRVTRDPLDPRETRAQFLSIFSVARIRNVINTFLKYVAKILNGK